MAALSPIPQKRYRILRQIGQGGMGTVYEATDLRLSRTVAWKETIVDNETSAKVASREAQVLANLRHSRLPKVLDHFWNGQKQILIMEFIQGEDLQALLSKRAAAFSSSDVLQWSIQLLEVLHYLHSHTPPVVHRDIKPANLKLSSVGELILLDFGLAKDSIRNSRLSSGRSIFGYTLSYAPPEQIRGDETSPRSDLYSFAATMYHMLTGVIPPDAFTRLSGIVDNGNDPLITISELNAKVPPSFARVLEQALSLKLENRPRNAAQILEPLRRIYTQENTQETTHVERNIPKRGFEAQVTMPADPPRLLKSFDEIDQTEQYARHNVPKVPFWMYVTGLIIALAVGAFALHSSRSRPNTVGRTTSAPKIVIPSPYLELSNSVVAIHMTDGSGKPLSMASGFFIKNDQIAIALSTIDGAVQGQATVGNQTYNIDSVASVDREHGLAILKVSGKNQTAIPIGNMTLSTDAVKVTIIGRNKTDEQIMFEPNAEAVYRKSDELIEVRGVPSVSGAALLDDHGDAIGIIRAGDDKGSGAVAIPAARIATLMNKPPQTMSLALAGASKLLYDFSKVGSEAGTDPKPVSAAVERKVLTAAFGSYLTDESQCTSDDNVDTTTSEGLRALRKAGQIVPRVLSTARGSFTKPGANQTAYSVLVGECGAAHVVNWGTKRLAIFEGEVVVANVDVKDHGVIDAIYDLDGDGVSEILISGAYMQMGHYFAWTQLIDVKDGKVHVLKDFKDVVDDSCGNSAEGNKRTVASIYYTQTLGRIPEFRVDQRRAKCSS